jgi:hypothetical protein
LGQIGDQQLLSGDTIHPLVSAVSAADSASICRLRNHQRRPDQVVSGQQRCWRDFVASQSRPAQSVVGHPNVAYAQDMASTIERLGFEAAISNGQSSSAVRPGYDVQVVVLSETLGTPTYQDIIYQLRAHPRTRRLPIALQFRTETIDVAWQADAARVAVQIYLVVDTRQFANYDEWLRRTRTLAGLRMPLLLIVRPGDTEIAFGWSAGVHCCSSWNWTQRLADQQAFAEQVQDAFHLTQLPSHSSFSRLGHAGRSRLSPRARPARMGVWLMDQATS